MKIQTIIALLALSATACGGAGPVSILDPKQDSGCCGQETGRPDSGKPMTGEDAGMDAPGQDCCPDAGQDTGKTDDAGDAGVDSSPDAGDAGKTDDAGDSGKTDDAGDSGKTTEGGSEGGVCIPTSCGPGNVPQAICDGGIVSFPACTGTDSVCLAGACVECAPSTVETPDTQCATSTSDPLGGAYFSGIQTCDSTGHWSPAVGCGSSTPVCTGPIGSGICGGVCQPGAQECHVEYGQYTKLGACLSDATCCHEPDYEGVETCTLTGEWGHAEDRFHGNCATGCSAADGGF